MRLIFIGFILLIFLGCSRSDRELLNSLSYKKEKFTNLRNGEKLIFKRGSDEEFIVIANYIPNPKLKLEEFFISANVELDDNSTFTINKQEPITQESISYKSLPSSLKSMVPEWSSIYKLSFKEIKAKSLTLVVNIDGEKKRAKFYKKPKYLLHKPSFKK